MEPVKKPVAMPDLRNLSVTELFQRANDHCNAKEYESALPYLTELSDKHNHGRAKARLGWMYYHGRGVPQDYSIALNYFISGTNASSQQEYAHYYLGFLSCLGNCVAQDYSKSMDHFRQASRLKNAGGHAGIGYLYHHGLGVLQNHVEAYNNYKNDPEHALAYYGLSILYRLGHGVKKDEHLAAECSAEAIKLRFSNSISDYEKNQLDDAANYLKQGEYTTAFVTFVALAHAENEEATKRLMQMCLDGQIASEENLLIAITIFQTTYEKNPDPKVAFVIAKAFESLPVSTLWGRSKEHSHAMLKWYKIASDGNDENAGTASYQAAMLLHELDTDLPSIPAYLKKAYDHDHPDAEKMVIKLSDYYGKKYEDSIIKNKIHLATADDLALVALDIKMNRQFREQEKLEHQRPALVQKSSQPLLFLSQLQAQFDRAQECVNNGYVDDAVSLLEPLAKLDFTKAQILLAQLYLSEYGTGQNAVEKAITLLNSALYNGDTDAGFLLVDYYLNLTAPVLTISKHVIRNIVNIHQSHNHRTDKEKVDALFSSRPALISSVGYWYGYDTVYLKAALKMAKIHFMEGTLPEDYAQDLAQEILSLTDNDTKFELIEWYLTRAVPDIVSAYEFLKTIHVAAVPSAYPKTQSLFMKIENLAHG